MNAPVSHNEDPSIHMVLELSPLGAFQADLTGNCLYVNREMETIYGSTDILGVKWTRAIYEEDLRLIKALLNRSVRSKANSYSFQFRIVHPKTGLRHCRVKARVVTGQDEKNKYIIGFIEDITSQLQRTEYLLIKNNLRTALNQIQDQFYASEDPLHLFNDLLVKLAKITRSEFGFLTEILPEESIENQVQKLATYGFDMLNQQPVNGKTPEEFTQPAIFYERLREKNTPYIISNNLPSGTKKIHSWLILPARINDELIGFIGLANRPEGYEADINLIAQFLKTYANLISLYKLKKAKHKTERDELALSEHLKKLITSLDDVIFEYDGNLVFRNVWVRDESILFIPVSEFIGKSVTEVFGEFGEKLAAPLKQALVTGEPTEFEYPHINPAEDKWYKARATLIRKDNDPGLCRIAMGVRDITESTRQNKEIKEAAECLEHLNYILGLTQELGNVAGWEYRFGADMTFYTKQAFTIFEIPEDFVTSTQAMNTFFSEEDVKKVEALSAQAISEKGSFQIEMRMTTGKKNQRWVKVIGTVLIVDGEVAGLKGATIDITEEKKAKEKLENVNLLLDMTQELGKIMGWEFKAGSDKIAFTNEAYKLYEVEPGFVLTTQNIAQFYSESDLNTLNRLAAEAVQKKGSYKLELPITTAKGNKKWVRLIATPVLDANNAVTSFRGATIDITEEKTSQERLEKINFLLDLTQELGKVSGWEFNFSSESMFITKQAYKLYELESDFVPTTISMMQFHSKEDTNYIFELAEKAVREKSSYQLEIELITAKKNKKWVRIIGIPLIVDDQVLGLRGATIDITEEKQAKDKLERLNSLMDITQELGKVGGWEYVLDGKERLFFTKQGLDIYEIDSDYVTSLENVRKFYNPEDVALLDVLAKRAMQERSSFKVELSMTTAKRNPKWIRTIAIPLIVDDRLMGLRGANIDITEEKEAKDGLERLNFLLDVTQELGKVGGWEFMNNSSKVTLTRQAKLIYEYEEDEEPSTENMVRFFKPKDLENMRNLARGAANVRGSYKTEMELTTAKKNKKWVRLIGIPLVVNNKLTGWRGATIDITEEKEAELSLLKITEKLEISNKDKDRILQMLAHDMRSPLSSIHTMAGLILDDKRMSNKNKEMIELIHESSASSYEMVGELIDALAGYDPETLIGSMNDLPTLIKRCVRIQQFRADEKHQSILIKSEQPVSTYLDAPKIERVINNLINNAIKFSPENSVISVSLKLENDSAVISVADNGIGVSEDMKEKVFDIFTRGKRYGTSGERPFGLGLSICRQIVTAHGGKIWLESKPGKGSVFSFDLPLTLPPKD